MGEPLVSIICTTYNHEPFIRQCLDGFIMQKTDFSFEVLIHDDASTDNTANIIREYETEYPDIIKPIYQTKNQYSKGVKIGISYLYPRARGKYIAECEGDDYWTDSFKLQKQVDFLEANPEIVLCTHHFSRYYQSSNKFTENLSTKIESNKNFGLKDYVNYIWLTQPLTSLYRRDCLDFQKLSRFPIMKDTIFFYYVLKSGQGYLMKDMMGVYRIHDSGIWSGVKNYEQAKSNISAIKSIYEEEKSDLAAIYLYKCMCCHGYLGIRFLVQNLKLLIEVLYILMKNFGLRISFKTFLDSVVFFKK